MFWLAFSLITLHYFFYPFLVFTLNILFKKKWAKGNVEQSDEEWPSVSLIIAAYNEKAVIEDKIEDSLDLHYPKDKYEIIVVSDGSTDETPEIVSKYAERYSQVTGLFSPPRKGKTAALNRAVRSAKGDVIVFSDANSTYNKDALKQLVTNLKDPSVGGVCGKKTIVKGNFGEERRAEAGDGLYWKFESKLKEWESNLGSIPTADGEIFCLRREDYPFPSDDTINDDMAITFALVADSKRVIYEPLAKSFELASIDLREDFNVKKRMVFGALKIMGDFPKFFNPFHNFFSLQFFIHKTLRYFMWALLVLIFASSVALFNEGWIYSFMTLVQLAFYGMSFLGYWGERTGNKIKAFYIPYYYCNVNLAAFQGFLLLFGKRYQFNDFWKKAKR